MIEDIRIITGTPKEVENKLATALTAHPKAEILSSAVSAGGDDADAPASGGKKKKSAVTVMVIVGNRH